jgi:hypothetical protein
MARRYFALGGGIQGCCTNCARPKTADDFRTCEKCRERKRQERLRVLERIGPAKVIHLVPRSPVAFVEEHVMRRDYTPRPAPEVEYEGQHFWVVYNGTVS